SEFWEEEKNGMLKASSKIEVVDLVTIRERHNFRLFTDGDYPVLRGTLLSSPNYEENYLYTTGYIPSLGTYPGHRIPIPLQVIPDKDSFNTPIEDICNEILSFSKLDWNSSHFCKKLPVTIEVSQSVGNILAEIKAQKKESIDSHYYYYM
ncbi:MAG: argonaute/piwi family protein, partial [Candidatus Odinarchaeia archaeon]